MTIGTEHRQAEHDEALDMARLVGSIIRGLNLASDDDQILQALAGPALAAGASGAVLVYHDEEELQDGEPLWGVVAAAHLRAAASKVVPAVRLPLRDLPFTAMLRQHLDQTLYFPDVRSDSRLDDAGRQLLLGENWSAAALVPLVHAGTWIGSLSLLWDEPRPFGAYERRLCATLMEVAGPALMNRRLVARLQRSEHRRTLFAAMIENSLDFIAITDMEGRVVFANPAAARLLGRSTEEMLRLHVADLHPAGTQDLDEAGKQRLSEQQSVSLEHELVHREGYRIPVSMVATMIRDPEGRPIGVGAVMRDLTESRRAAAERERMQEEIIQAQQAAIQELSTPIIPIVDGIIVLPLVGNVNTIRARSILRALLEGIRQHRAKVVILDVTGVAVVDTGVAHHLNKTIQAARLKGAHPIVTGLSDSAAETIVEMGIDWGGVETLGDLQTGLTRALTALGLKLGR